MQLNKLKFTKLQVKEFADYYNSGHTIKEVANYFNIGYREALHYLIYFGYYTPKRKQNNICNYCINEDFFEIIDTQDKAYYLGFLMADGYVINTLYNKEIGMALQCCDKYILDKLNNYTSPDKLVIKYKNSYKWKVTSSKMFLDLNNYGITENKSHT